MEQKNNHIFTLPTFDKQTKRLYLKLELTFIDELNSNYATALIDTGADVNLINVNFLNRLFPNLAIKLEDRLENTDVKVQGFSGADIKLLGSVKVCVRGHERLSYNELEFLVYDIENGYPVILGLKVLEQLSLNLIYKSQNSVKRPHLVHENPEFENLITSYHLSDFDNATCNLSFILPPESSDFFHVKLPPYLNFIQGDTILISDDFVENNLDKHIEICPTTSELQQNYFTGELEATVQICNHSQKTFASTITLSFENVNNCEAKEIDILNLKQLDFPSLITPISMDEIVMPSQPLPPEALNAEEDMQSAEVETFPYILDVNLTSLCYLPQNAFLLDTIFPQHNEFVYGDPKCLNNNTSNPDISLTDSRMNLPPFNECTPELEEKFRDPKQTIKLGIQDYNDEDLEKEIRHQGGFSVPNNLHLPAEHFVNLEDYEVEQRPYLKKLFIEKFPELVSRHSLDLGNLSKTLGKYRLKLKKFAKLPKFRKIYYLNSSELQQLQVILQFLLKYDAISKIGVEGDDKNLHMDSFASPSYLIPRSNPASSARLIVNYRHLNQLIEQEACHIDTAQSCINSFRNSYLFSNLDLSCAFQSIRLTEDSRDLTLFSTPLGTFRSHILPTGIKSSPNTLSSIMHQAIHYEIIRDHEGNIQYEGELPAMKYSPIPNVKNIYDDLIIGSPLKSTYIETLDAHFELLEKVLERLHFHSGKLSFPKCHFARTCIAFFGVFLMYNFVCVDPARIQKILDRPFPENLKGMRSVLGLINSVRDKLGFDYNLDIQWLHDLTRTKLKDFKPTTEHFEAFARVKKTFSNSSLFANIIEPNADKILFTDSAVGPKSCFSAVLAQIVKPNNEPGKVHIPNGLNLADKNHRFIFDNRKAYKPLPLFKEGQTLNDYRLMIREGHPPQHEYLSKEFFDYTAENAHLSLTQCIQHMYKYWQKPLDLKDLCTKMSTNIKENVYGAQYKTLFHSNMHQYKLFLKNLQNGILLIDKDFIIFEVLAEALRRPIHVISTYYIQHEPLRIFGVDYTTPPLCLLIYQCAHKPGQTSANTKEIKLVQNKIITKKVFELSRMQEDSFFLVALPAVIPNIDSFRYDRFRGGFEIVSYLSKAMPEAKFDKHIYEMELDGILIALAQYRKLIGNANLLLLTDNKCLYYLFSESMLESSYKLSRWKGKLIQDYSNMEFGFVKSQDNLADFLSRRYEIEKPVIRRLQLPRYVKEGLEYIMDKEVYTMQEWAEFVNDNPSYLVEKQNNESTIENHYKIRLLSRAQLAERHKSVNVLGGRMGRTYTNLIAPQEHLRVLLCNENVIKEQKIEFKELYTKCLAKEIVEDGVTYFLENNLLFREKDFDTRVMLPTKYVNPMAALGHVSCNHTGYEKISKNLMNIYHPLLLTRVKELCAACFPCQLANYPTKQQKLGYYNTDGPVMGTLCMDLAENLPQNNGFKHLCIVVDPISDITLTFPMRNKTSNEFIMFVLFNLYPLFPNFRQILCDGGAHFVSHQTLQLLTAYGIRVIYSAAFHSYGHGSAESHVRTVKNALIKTCVNEKTYNWLYAIPKIMANHNQMINPKTKFSPLEFLYGKSTPLSSSPLTDLTNLTNKKIHPRLRDKRKQIELITSELEEIVREGKKNIEEERKRRIEERNKNRVDMPFKVGDVVLVKSHSKILGKPSALQPYFQFCPYEVIEIHPTTASVARLTDKILRPEEKANIGYLPKEFKYPKHQLKSIKALPEHFRDLHPRVLNMLTKTIDDITSDDIKFLIQKEDWDLPPPYSIHELIEKEEKERALNEKLRTEEVVASKPPQGEEPPLGMAEEDNFSSDEETTPVGKEKDTPTHRHNLRQNPKKVTFNDFVTK